MECPKALLDNDLNVKNHLSTIKNNGLGPADPAVSNDDFGIINLRFGTYQLVMLGQGFV